MGNYEDDPPGDRDEMRSNMTFKISFPFLCKSKKKKRLICRCNDFRFNRWLDTTSVHGIAHVFHGKSPCRRMFWSIIFFVAFAVCFYEVIGRFRLYFSYPTSTTTTFKAHESIDFPAITFCNLNPVRKTFADQHNLGNILDFMFNPSKLGLMDKARNFSRTCKNLQSNLSQEVAAMEFSTIIKDQALNKTDFIVHCSFGTNIDSDDYYDCTDQFTLEHHSLGVCYTFNSHLNASSRQGSKMVHNSGEKHGLRVILNINQDEYSSSLNGNAGVKLSINKFGNIPDLEEKGILVPPGMNAYVALRTNRVIDRTRGRKCERSNPSYSYYHSDRYSAGVCKASKFAEAIDKECNCLYHRTTSNPMNSKNCTVNDICCVSQLRLKHSSKCPEPCDEIAYTPQTSYASFPSAAFANELSQMLNLSVLKIYRDIVAVNVYFEDIGITVTETTNPYQSSDFLSDLGGILGLFLGASVISLLELALLVFDEIKDRTWKKSWKKKLSVLEHNVFDGHIPEVTGNKKDDWEDVSVEEINHGESIV